MLHKTKYLTSRSGKLCITMAMSSNCSRSSRSVKEVPIVIFMACLTSESHYFFSKIDIGNITSKCMLGPMSLFDFDVRYVCDGEVLSVSRQAEGGRRRSLNVRLTIIPWYQGLRSTYLKLTPLSAMFAVVILV